MIDSMFPFEVFSNRKGIGPAVSSLILLVVTIFVMSVVIGASQTLFSAQSAQLSERLSVEKVLVNGDYVDIYLRNTGENDITLEYVIINGDWILLDHKVVLPAITANLEAEATVVTVNKSAYTEDLILIRFFSSQNNVLGNVGVGN